MTEIGNLFVPGVKIYMKMLVCQQLRGEGGETRVVVGQTNCEQGWVPLSVHVLEVMKGVNHTCHLLHAIDSRCAANASGSAQLLG